MQAKKVRGRSSEGEADSDGSSSGTSSVLPLPLLLSFKILTRCITMGSTHLQSLRSINLITPILIGWWTKWIPDADGTTSFKHLFSLLNIFFVLCYLQTNHRRALVSTRLFDLFRSHKIEPAFFLALHGLVNAKARHPTMMFALWKISTQANFSSRYVANLPANFIFFLLANLFVRNGGPLQPATGLTKIRGAASFDAGTRSRAGIHTKSAQLTLGWNMPLADRRSQIMSTMYGFHPQEPLQTARLPI